MQLVRLHFKRLDKPVRSGSWQCLVIVSTPGGPASPVPALDVAEVVSKWFAKVPTSVHPAGERYVRVRWYMP